MIDSPNQAGESPSPIPLSVTLLALRNKRHWSQDVLAEKSHISKGTIWATETGRRLLPKYDKWRTLVETFTSDEQVRASALAQWEEVEASLVRAGVADLDGDEEADEAEDSEGGVAADAKEGAASTTGSPPSSVHNHREIRAPITTFITNIYQTSTSAAFSPIAVSPPPDAEGTSGAAQEPLEPMPPTQEGTHRTTRHEPKAARGHFPATRWIILGLVLLTLGAIPLGLVAAAPMLAPSHALAIPQPACDRAAGTFWRYDHGAQVTCRSGYALLTNTQDFGQASLSPSDWSPDWSSMRTQATVAQLGPQDCGGIQLQMSSQLQQRSDPDHYGFCVRQNGDVSITSMNTDGTKSAPLTPWTEHVGKASTYTLVVTLDHGVLSLSVNGHDIPFGQNQVSGSVVFLSLAATNLSGGPVQAGFANVSVAAQ